MTGNTNPTAAPVPEHDDFITAEQPWPGLAAFTELSHSFFHGRTQATGELVRLVSTSHAGVLFGQSGLGKTSLIQAGLFPVLRQDDHLPVYVRLDHAETAPPLSAQILSSVAQECRSLNVDCPAPQADDTLWSYFHRQNADFWADGIRLLSPVLVLDQFEEIFTQGQQSATTQARAAAFIDDLAGLVENRAPHAIRQRISAEPTSAREFDFARANFRLMLSLREDFLPELEGLMPQMPTLRLNRLRLLPMNGLEALQVVKGGGALVEPQASERIVRFVAADQKARPLSELAVEPSLLSLICRELNLRRQSEGLPQITTDLLTGARDDILGKFYQRCLDDQAPELGDFIEDHLLSESGYRNAMVLEDARRLPRITRTAIDTLIQRRLLRLEERSGLLRVELTHDVLTQVARERRSQRREAQAKALLQQQMEKSRKRMRRITALAVFMLLLVVGMAGLSWQMFRAKADGDHNLALALAEKADRAFAEQRVNEGLIFSTHALARIDPGRDQALGSRLRGARLMHSGIVTLSGHGHYVYSVAFSPDGKTLASASGDKTLRLWDIASSKLLGEPLRGHTDKVHSVAFSPDGRILATGSQDKTIRLWDVVSRKPLGEPLRGHMGGIDSVVFSPDGKTLATGSDDKTIRLWDIASRKLLGEPLHGHEHWIMSVAFSPDGKTLATGSGDNTVRLWDVASRKPLSEPLRGHAHWVDAVVFSPDGKSLATGSRDQTVILWDVGKRRPLGKPLRGHAEGIDSIAFSPDGRILATGSGDRTVRLWDIATNKPLGEPLLGHLGWVKSVAFSPDGKTLATGSEDRTVRLWDIVGSKPPSELLRGHEYAIHSIAFSPDGKTLATIGANSFARLWDVASGEPLGEPLSGHVRAINAVAFSPDGKTLATASADRTVRLWDIANRKPLGGAMRGHTGAIISMAFRPDGETLATSSWDATVRLWDVPNRKPLPDETNQHEFAIHSVVFSQDGKMLATAGVDKMVRLRDLVSGKLFKPLRGHDYEIFSIAFSPNGKVLATGGRDKTVRLWSTATGELLGEPLRGHEDWIYSVSFSPDGNTLATASGDKTVRLWDIVSRKPIASLSGHEMEVKSVAFSPDGRTLVSGSMDKTVRMWAIGPTELAITDWRAQATKDEARYGLKLEGVNLVPWSQSLAGAKP